MRGVLSAIQQAVDGVVRWVVILFMLVMTVAVCLQIVFRYIFNVPLGWSEEVARFSFVWVSFFGASALMRVREHINVNVLVERFPPRVRAACVLLADLVSLFCVYFFVVGGISLTANEWEQLAPATQIPMGWVYLAIPISAVLMAGWVVLQTVASGLRLWGKGPA